MWLLASLAAVLVLKAYTSREIKKLRARIYQARRALRDAKEKEHPVKKRHAGVEDALERTAFRVEQMKRVIADLNLRLERADMEEVAVAETPFQGDVAQEEV